MMIRFIFIALLLASCQSKETTEISVVKSELLGVLEKIDYQKENTLVFKDSVKTDSVGYDLFVDKEGELYLKTIIPQSCYNPKQILLNSTLYLDEKNTAKIAKYIDIMSFRALGQGYYQDKKHVYYAFQKKVILMQDADCQSFKVLKKKQALDKKHHYLEGLKRAIYPSNRGFQSVDFESLNYLGNDSCQDKNYKFFVHTRCIKQLK